LSELETELQTLRQATDAAMVYMHARGERLEKRLLNIPEHVRGVVEYGVHHGATVALATAQVRSSHDLCFIVGFPEGEGAADHGRLVEDFNETANAVIAEVPVEEVILEAL
jgi:hypothetical protein